VKIITRRNALYASLLAAAVSTAVTTGAMIPVVSALAQDARPSIAISAAVADREISEGMQTRISGFVHASMRLAAIDASGDTETVGVAAQERSKALVDLAFHQPANLVELAAKTAALVEFSEDVERFALRVLVEDATRLAEVSE
jgi:hypothetical protein